MIERAVIDQQYKSVGDFVDDINLVFTNCYDYNGPINGEKHTYYLLYFTDITKSSINLLTNY